MICPAVDWGIFAEVEAGQGRELHFATDPEVGMRLIIAVHSTVLGPAAGGLRMWQYASESAAVTDALRLSRGMTYKYAAAGVALGGGKAVLVGDPRRADRRDELMRTVGRVVDHLGGRFRIGEDVGTTLDDMEQIFTQTGYVNTLPADAGGVGDISFATARGTVEALIACAENAWGSSDLTGRSVALQGLGMVGAKAAAMLSEQGAKLFVSDIDDERVTRVADELGATPVATDEIHALDVDVFAPYALGAVVNDTSINQIRAKIVVGSANNILAEDRHAAALASRGIVYGVDFIANAGGAIYDADRLRKGGFISRRALADVDAIGDRMREVFDIARTADVTPLHGAYQLAERRLSDAARLRSLW